MHSGSASILASSAALTGAPLLASAADDVVLVASVIAAAAVIAIVIGAVAPRFSGERHDGGPPGGVERRSARLSDDPIVAALGIGNEDAMRARRRRRPIGDGLNSPPGDSPPPT